MEPNKPVNPYQSPSVEIMSAAPDADADFIDGGRSVPAGNGLSWIGTGWGIFTQSPIAWIVCAIIILVVLFALGLIPFLGGLISSVLIVVLAGGLMLGCQAQYAGRPFEIGDLFAGFKDKAGPLIILGLLYVAATVALFAVAGILFMIFIGSTGLFGALLSGNQEALGPMMAGSIMAFFAILAIVLLLFVPIVMAFLFSPALVSLQNVSPVAAIRMSFFACLKNIVPIILFFIVGFVILVIATLPFGLGLLVAMPLMYGSIHAAYRDIFLVE
jgi:uncharacterized membrane protein